MSEPKEPQFVFIPEPSQTPEVAPQGPIVTPRRRASAWPWLLLGIPLGIVGTIAWQKTGEPPAPKFIAPLHWPGEPTSAPSSAAPSPTGIASASPTAPDSTTALDIVALFQSLNFLPMLLGGPDIESPPPDPVPGGPMSRGPISMPPPIQGDMPTLPNVGPGGPSIRPIGSGNNPVQPSDETIPDVALVSMVLQCGEADIDASESKINKIVGRLGGTTKKYSELAEKKEADRSAILIVVPIEKRETATAQLKAAGANVDDNWQGNPRERAIILQERLDIALHNLQRDRDKLLQKYFSDASPVKDIEERIQFAEKQIAATKIAPSAKSAVFRIFIGPNA